MKKIFFICCFLIVSFSITAQEKKSAIDGITTTIQNYYDGYIYRDFTKLKKAFDLENGAMKVPILKDEKVIGFKNRYFKEVVPKWGNRKKLSDKVLERCTLTILNIDVVDVKIASAKISMKVDAITYVDILSLHKIGNDWKISNKIYVVRKYVDNNLKN
jgi:hypothetical protein